MSYVVTVSHIDTCLSCYLQDHHTREGETLIGVYVDRASRYHHVKSALLDAVCVEGDFPEDMEDDVIRAAIVDAFSTAHPLKSFDSSLDAALDDDSGESAQAWFLFTWERAETDPDGDSSDDDNNGSPDIIDSPEGARDATTGETVAEMLSRLRPAMVPQPVQQAQVQGETADSYARATLEELHSFLANHERTHGYRRGEAWASQRAIALRTAIARRMVPQPVQQAQAQDTRAESRDRYVTVSIPAHLNSEPPVPVIIESVHEGYGQGYCYVRFQAGNAWGAPEGQLAQYGWASVKPDDGRTPGEILRAVMRPPVSDALRDAYRWHRANAYTHRPNDPRRDGATRASVCLANAREDVARGLKRYIETDNRPNVFAPLAEPCAAHHSAGPNRERWIERPASIGLRFVGWADELVRSIQHTGWFTSEDGDNGANMRGCVYQFPARNGRAIYVPAYGDPNNTLADCGGAAYLDFTNMQRADVGDEADCDACRDAARAADGLAETHAESERDYQEAWQAGSEFVELGEEYRTARRDYLQAMRELRSGPTFVRRGAAHRSVTEHFLDVRDRIAPKRAQLARDYMNTEAFREHLPERLAA